MSTGGPLVTWKFTSTEGEGMGPRIVAKRSKVPQALQSFRLLLDGIREEGGVVDKEAGLATMLCRRGRLKKNFG